MQSSIAGLSRGVCQWVKRLCSLPDSAYRYIHYARYGHTFWELIQALCWHGCQELWQSWFYFGEIENSKISKMEIVKHFVSSSNVDAVGYDEGSQTVRVWFLDGSVYDYRNVNILEYEALRDAPSVGSYLHRNYKGQ